MGSERHSRKRGAHYLVPSEAARDREQSHHCKRPEMFLKVIHHPDPAKLSRCVRALGFEQDYGSAAAD